MNTAPVEKSIDLSTANGTSELEAHVQLRLSGQVRNFRVRKGDRGLILSGQGRTYYAKQLAQHAVMEATDLPILANEIEIL